MVTKKVKPKEESLKPLNSNIKKETSDEKLVNGDSITNTILPQSPNHQTKDKILYCLMKESLSVKELSNKLDIAPNAISNHIHRYREGVGEEGLLEDGLILKEKKIDNNVYYKATEAGIKHIETIIEAEERKIKEENKVILQRKEQHKTVEEQIDDFVSFIDKNNISPNNGIVFVDFKELVRYNYELGESLLENPEDVLKCFELAVENTDHNEEVKNYRVRLDNLPKNQKLSIRDIRAKHLGKLFFFEGTIRQKSDVRPQVTAAKFECPNCGNIIAVLQLDTTFKEPTKCGCGRKGKFRMLNKELIDIQGIVLEDFGEHTDIIEVKRMNVLIKEDLCNDQKKILVGGRIQIIGTIKEVPIVLRSGGKSTKFDLIIEANNIKSLEETTINITNTDIKKIKEFTKKYKEKTLKNLINKFANHIEGNDEIKKSLILQQVSKDDQSLTIPRCRIHLHIFGYYGAGKTQLCLESFRTAVKSVKCDATQSSNVGLTAAAVKDEFLGGWALEAGAVVLAGDGLCFIDEIDKRKDEDSSSLGEPMESGSVTVNKANIHQTLSSPAKVLLCGNFKLNSSESEISADALCISNHVIDRCDLTLKAEEIDSEKLGQKIFNNLSRKRDTEHFEFLRKYFYYSEKFKLDKEPFNKKAQHKLICFFKQVKRTYPKFSARMLESLIRLSVSSAKLRLNKQVDYCDVDIAIELMKRSLQDRNYQVTIIEEEYIESESDKSKVILSEKSFMQVFKQLENELGKTIDTQLLENGIKKQYNLSNFDIILKGAKRHGLIFEPKSGYLQRL